MATVFDTNLSLAEARRQGDLFKKRYLPTEYYTGSQVRIYFADIWVDDIITIQWDGVSNKAPIYGYASQLFDGVLNGTFIVNGSFTLAFRKVGYLPTILDRLRQLDPVSRKKAAASIAQANNMLFLGTDIKKANINTVLDGLLSKDFAAFDTVSNVLKEILFDAGDSPRQVRADEMDRLGNPLKLSHIGTGFDIMVAYGDISAPGGQRTIITINDVHITGVGQLVAPNGDPIAERYSFFARNLYERLPTSSNDNAPIIPVSTGLDSSRESIKQSIKKSLENESSTNFPTKEFELEELEPKLRKPSLKDIHNQEMLPADPVGLQGPEFGEALPTDFTWQEITSVIQSNRRGSRVFQISITHAGQLESGHEGVIILNEGTAVLNNTANTRVINNQLSNGMYEVYNTDGTLPYIGELEIAVPYQVINLYTREYIGNEKILHLTIPLSIQHPISPRRRWTPYWGINASSPNGRGASRYD